jgi:hypothetical protein
MRHCYDLLQLAAEAVVLALPQSAESAAAKAEYNLISRAHFARSYSCPDEMNFVRRTRPWRPVPKERASGMAGTLKNSGSGARPPVTGEFGWSGGALIRGKKGYWIAAFNGGMSKDDVQVSKAGSAVLQHRRVS